MVSTPRIEPGRRRNKRKRNEGTDSGLGNVEEDVGGAVTPTLTAMVGWDGTSIPGMSFPETLSLLGS